MSLNYFSQTLFGKKALKNLGHFEYLFLALILSVLIKPFFKGFIGIQILTNLLLTIIYLAAILTVSNTPKILKLSIALAVPPILFTWLSYFVPGKVINIISLVFSLLFFIYTIFLMLLYLVRQKRVTRSVIMCAMSTYFLMAIMWATAFLLLESVLPGSFQNINIKDPAADFFYFSFVTITTLGYGDILPFTAKAKALIITETILGQLYVAIMIARLVGIQISQEMEDDKKK